MTFAIRDAREQDAEEIVALIADLGHTMTAEGIRGRIAALERSDCPQLVAVAGDRVIGVCGLHIMSPLHRPHPVGRITILAVEQNFRGQGIGRALIDTAQGRLLEAGCGLVEVTSHERLVDAHEFYRRLGFEQTSKRFAKQL